MDYALRSFIDEVQVLEQRIVVIARLRVDRIHAIAHAAKTLSNKYNRSILTLFFQALSEAAANPKCICEHQPALLLRTEIKQFRCEKRPGLLPNRNIEPIRKLWLLISNCTS